MDDHDPRVPTLGCVQCVEARYALYRSHAPASEDEDQTGRYVLVEKSGYDTENYVTTWPTPDDAAAYHDGQECPDDWPIEVLLDRETGQSWDAETKTTWVPEIL